MNAVTKYFSEFSVLKRAPKEFWIVLMTVFADSLAYFAMTTVLSLYLTYTIGFDDMDAGSIIGIWINAILIIVLNFAVLNNMIETGSAK